MRNVAVVVAILLRLTVVARAADVEIERPHIVFLSESGASIACNSASRRACTTVNTEFFCACARAGDQWTVWSRFIATPFVYTTTHSVVRHELEHVADIRSSLSEYGDSLALHSFPSEAACTSFINGEMKMFPHTMKLIQRLTTVKRDGIQFAATLPE